MSPHETIKLNVATAIRDSVEIRDYCIQHFGRGLQVIVNRYGDEGYPGEEEAPFAFLYSDGENESGAVDENTFDFVVVVGGVDAGSSPRKAVSGVRSDSANGMVVSGIAAEVEELREKVIEILKASTYGACFRTVVRSESNLNDYPLEWAKCRASFFEPETLN